MKTLRKTCESENLRCFSPLSRQGHLTSGTIDCSQRQCTGVRLCHDGRRTIICCGENKGVLSSLQGQNNRIEQGKRTCGSKNRKVDLIGCGSFQIFSAIQKTLPKNGGAMGVTGEIESAPPTHLHKTHPSPGGMGRSTLHSKTQL